MDTLLLIVEAIVLIGAIVMGTRSSGVGLGLWGGLGVFVFVFVFREQPGSPPIDAVLIVLAVVLAASTMQAAGGIDWMVSVAANVIRKRPQQITLIAPLISFLFAMGAGTANILYPLLPVIFDVSYKNKVRPERALSMSVVATGLGVVCSPVSAAMAAMITLTDVDPYNFDLVKVLSVVVPAALVGIVGACLLTAKRGKEIMEDPEVLARIESGELEPPGEAGDSAGEITVTAAGRNSAVIFLFGVMTIVVLGLFSGLRPMVGTGDEAAPLGMSTTIQLVMFTVGTIIMLVSKPKVAEIPGLSVFKAGMTSAIALFGLAWLTDTFMTAHQDLIVDTIGGWVQDYSFIFAIALVVIAALTTSQSTATRTIVPIGLAAGMPIGLVVGMWPAAGGIYVLPTNGTQIAAANFDRSGTTHLGTKMLDHSFLVPMLITTVITVAVGAVIGTALY